MYVISISKQKLYKFNIKIKFMMYDCDERKICTKSDGFVSLDDMNDKQ